MSKKQSSIDWFLNEFSKQIEFVPESELDKWFKELIPKAKAMHREEIEDAWNDGHTEGMEGGYCTTYEEYYNETFKK
jgi:hypothetical protein